MPLLTKSRIGQTGGGIISNAIATAGKGPLQGQENASLLQQHVAPERELPTSSQFTFTCESQTPGAIQWPGKSNSFDRNGLPRTNHCPGRSVGQSTPSQALQHLPAGALSNPGQHEGNSLKQVSRIPASSARKNRRRLERELVAAARTRRQIATENYYHSLVNPEDIWICEFCEYERIFGEPPRTLIRDYEIKERRQRQEEADRKRLLEKAKAKSRKGKKASKAAAKGGLASEHASDQSHAAARPADVSPVLANGRCRSTHSNDGYGDEYEENYSDAPARQTPNIARTHADPLPPPRAKT